MPRRQKRLAFELEHRDSVSAAKAPKVQVEVMSWLTRHVGGDGSGRVYFDQEFTPGETLKTVLQRLGKRLPKLDRELWDPATGELWEFVVRNVARLAYDSPHSLLRLCPSGAGRPGVAHDGVGCAGGAGHVVQ